jgi:5,10-methylenetetrahydromethanopterin reductase
MAGGDRFGVRWGLAGGTTIASVGEARAVARYADAAGFDSLWISHATGVDPVVALACAAPDIGGLSEVGTSVVPLYGRHPIGLAQLARTAQSALGGRFTLGVGAASRGAVRERMGLAWDRPLQFTREFLDGLQPLLAGRPADVTGAQLSTHAELAVDAPDTPVLLAALGPRMLELAGQRVQGTSLGQCGPRTIATYVAPTIRSAADAAGRPEPRIMALVRLCVTPDAAAHAAALALARATAARYREVPSYRAVQDREGLAEPAELHLLGSWAQILDGLAGYAEAGVTDLRLEIAAPDEATRQATRRALAGHLGGRPVSR